jgi:RNA-binding protein YlmH
MFQIEQDSDEILAKGDKVFKVRLATTRLDAILKTGLNISRKYVNVYY